MSVQNEYRISPGPTPPRFVGLKVAVAGMEDASVAALKQRVEAFASELRADGLVADVTENH